MKTDKWLESFNNLDEKNQLKVVEKIVDWLKTNESSFILKYDKERLILVREFFENLIINIEEKYKDKRIIDILKKYDSLTEEHKDDVINYLVIVIEEKLKKEEQKEKEDKCEEVGHLFGDWESQMWIPYEHVADDHGYPVKREKWSRECSRCGYIETVFSEPIDLNKKNNVKKTKSKKKKK